MLSFAKQFISLMSPYRRQIGRIFIILSIFEAVKIVPAWILKRLLDTLTGSMPTSEMVALIGILAAGMFIAETVVAAVDFLADRCILVVIQWADKHLPSRVQDKLLTLSLGYHEREQTGEKIARLERGTERLNDMLAGLLWMLIPLVLQIFWTASIIAVIDWQIMIVFAAVIPIFVVLTWRFHKRTHRVRVEQEDLYEQSSGSLGESIINIKTVQAFAQETRERGRYQGLRERIDILGRSRIESHIRSNFWRRLIVNAASCAMILLAGRKVLTGELSVGSVVLLLTLAQKVYSSLFSLTQVMDKMVEASEPLQRLFGLLETAPDIPLPVEPKIPSRWQGEIKFDHVSFAYAGSGRVIDEMDLVIRPGETIAFAGPSGGGKSTIVKLLLRFYDPTMGKILIDGVDLREIDLLAFRSRVGYVPQEVEIMSGSIWYNLTYGCPQATEEDVYRAARSAHVDEFVSGLPQGYHTLVGERGMKLSGGQRQRLGIARALLLDPMILIFDEATSALDAEAEAAIQSAMAEVAGKKVTILIAHRLSTIRGADRICVIKDGRLVESGSHTSLLSEGGVYHRLVRLQAGAHQTLAV